VISDDRGLKSPVVLDILKDFDDRFRTQSVPDGVSSRSQLACFGFRPGAVCCIAPIGFDLS
jgi:hypothetical protein